MPEPDAEPEATIRRSWERWQDGLTLKPTLLEELPPLRMLLVLEVAVGNALSGVPPRRSVRAELPHTAPTSGAWRRSVRSGTGAGPGPWESNDRRVDRTAPT